MTKIEGYEDCHMVNESNGGETRQGDAFTREDEGRKSNPSPTRTKAELVEIMIQAIHPDVGKIYRRVMQVEQGAALDALIAIGAVRVK